jgi:hypothetical protein
MRLHMRRLTRLTLAFSKKHENFVAAVGQDRSGKTERTYSYITGPGLQASCLLDR